MTTYEVAGEAQLLAAYTCTPLVRIPTSQLKPGEKIKGTTVAELGRMNNPLDMVVYNKGGKDYLLMSNDRRGVMKIDLSKVGTQDGINAKVAAETAGLPFETLKDLKGVVQLSQLDKTRFVRIHRSFLLNVERLARIEPYAKDSWLAVLADGTRPPVSRTGYSRLKWLIG